MALIDSHCHLDFEAFDSGRDALIQACVAHDITHLILPGVRRGNWSECSKLALQHSAVKYAAGLHPYFVSEHKQSDLEVLETLLTEPDENLVAVGEIGLDDTCEHLRSQEFFFESQLELAEKAKLPVIMHMRKNHGQGHKRVRTRSLVGGVVHAFSGSYQDAMQWIDLGMKIGVGGIITYERASKTRDTVAKLPLSSIVLETDAPDMAIQGAAKGAGTPLMVRDVFSALCALRNEGPEEIESVTFNTTKTLFGFQV